MSTPMRIPEGKIVLTYYQDYVLLPNDGKRYEILEGELTVTPAPTTKHQTASGNLFVLLAHYIKQRDLGKLFHAPIDLILVCNLTFFLYPRPAKASSPKELSRALLT